ncbi:hypothetical protein HMI55_001576 [Coelomomyces lativittatus]|nr:hypothetical protein HMI55_001576 [Coelomomyces lativittatus]
MPRVFDPLNPPILEDEQISLLTFVFIIMIGGLLINTFFNFILLRNFKQVIKNSNLVLCLNLSAADMIFYIRGLILRRPLLEFRSFPKNTDPAFHGMLHYIFGCYAFFSLVLIAFERYTIIVRGVQTTLRRLLLGMVLCFLLAIFSSWMAVLLVDIPYLYSDSGLYFSIHIGEVTLGGYFLTVYVLLIQLVALNLLIFCYYHIVKEVRTALFSGPSITMTYSLSLSRHPGSGIKKNEKSVDFKSINMTTVSTSLTSPPLPPPSSTKDPSSFPMSTTAPTTVSSGTEGTMSTALNPILSMTTTSSATFSRASRRSKELELQIARKALAISSIHLILWLPYISYCFLTLIGVTHLQTLDYCAVIGVECSSLVNSIFSIVMDPKVRKFVFDFFSFRKK